MNLRPYQSRVLDELWQWFASHPAGNPIIEAVVGAGKSVLIAELCKRAIAAQPDCRILMVVHQKELLEQNLEKLRAVWPAAPVGIYSASLNSKQLDQITYCTIGSVAKKAHLLGHVDLMLADECHLINPKEAGMWRGLVRDLSKFCPNIRVIGWTGTPFRGDGVWLTAAEDPLFTHIASRVTMRELLSLGYLAPLVAGGNTYRVSADGIQIVNGDYNIRQLAARVDREDVVREACSDLVKRAADRDRWLVFCATIEHSIHVRDELKGLGIVAESVSADTPAKEREEIIARFRSGETRALCNVAVLTTGFDVPAVDCIALLRNTRSPVLYVQIAGRGMRVLGANIEESKLNGKADCLWLDYTDTTETLGPVDAVAGRGPRRKKESMAPIKLCEACGNTAPISARECPECGAPFPIEETAPHRVQAADVPILTLSKPKLVRYEVTEMNFARHQKAGKPPSMRVTYLSGLHVIATEYVCFEHEGYAAKKAVAWWWLHVGGLPPATVSEAMTRLSQVKKPKTIVVNESGKYPEIFKKEWNDESQRPEDRTGGSTEQPGLAEKHQDVVPNLQQFLSELRVVPEVRPSPT